MAYICGYVTNKEKAELERRGWDIEPAPEELWPEESTPEDGTYIMIWVDSSVLEMMSGPDWDTGRSEGYPKTCGKCGGQIKEPGPCPHCKDSPFGRGER
jgi:hypothetical protein